MGPLLREKTVIDSQEFPIQTHPTPAFWRGLRFGVLIIAGWVLFFLALRPVVRAVVEAMQ